MPDLSVFIPAYNAEKHLAGVIKRFPESLWPDIKSLWIINDGSTDGTQKIIEQLKREHKRVKSINFSINQGYGAAVKAGLNAVNADSPDYTFCIHADGQYAPEGMPDFIKAAEKKGLDLVQGSRMAPGTALEGGMPLYKYAAGKMLTAMENFVFGMRLSDYHSGYLCYGKKTLGIPFEGLSNSFDFDLEVIACARKRGLRIGEVGIPTQYADETSHLNPITYGFRVLGVLMKYLA
ncbi:glycosyltransferase family 2 protein, partial [Fibrobacterota bacterium]